MSNVTLYDDSKVSIDNKVVDMAKSKQKKVMLEALKRGYKVQKDGSVLSPYTGKALSVYVEKRGYARFTINRTQDITGTNTWGVYVHQAIAFLKYGVQMLEKGVVVRHLDGNARNNNWENIAIGTCSENEMDKKKEDRIRVAKIARSAQGGSAHLHKLCKRDVTYIRSLCKGFGKKAPWGMVSKLASRFNVHRSTIDNIINNKIYKEYI